MMYGYDRQAVINGFYHGQVAVAEQIVVPALGRLVQSHTMQYPYDPAKARAMLDAAGWRSAPDGIRRKGNARLSFEFMLNQGSALITDEMLTFVADMRAIGIDTSRSATGFRVDHLADVRGQLRPDRRRARR